MVDRNAPDWEPEFETAVPGPPGLAKATSSKVSQRTLGNNIKEMNKAEWASPPPGLAVALRPLEVQGENVREEEKRQRCEVSNVCVERVVYSCPAFSVVVLVFCFYYFLFFHSVDYTYLLYKSNNSNCNGVPTATFKPGACVSLQTMDHNGLFSKESRSVQFGRLNSCIKYSNIDKNSNTLYWSEYVTPGCTGKETKRDKKDVGNRNRQTGECHQCDECTGYTKVGRLNVIWWEKVICGENSSAYTAAQLGLATIIVPILSTLFL